MTRSAPPLSPTDPLDMSLLASIANREAATEAVIAMTGALQSPVSLYATLTALGAVFMGLCDDHGLDAGAGMAQITSILNCRAGLGSFAAYPVANVMLELN